MGRYSISRVVQSIKPVDLQLLKRGVWLMMRLILLVAVTEDDGVGLWEVSLDGLNMDTQSKGEQARKRTTSRDQKV